MQFDWTTFVLEAINFLVLVWILKRFLYRPVLDALDARQQRIQAETAQAERLQQEAETLKQQYQANLAEWEKEREQARAVLEEELTQLRTTGMQNIKKCLDDEEAKLRAKAASAIASREVALIRQASGEAYGYAAALLKRLASPELTANIVQVFLEDLSSLPVEELTALRKAGLALEEGTTVEIAVAHLLNEASLATLSQALTTAVGRTVHAEFKLAPELIAGLRVAVGEYLLHANVADEFGFFRRSGGPVG